MGRGVRRSGVWKEAAPLTAAKAARRAAQRAGAAGTNAQAVWMVDLPAAGGCPRAPVRQTASDTHNSSNTQQHEVGKEDEPVAPPAAAAKPPVPAHTHRCPRTPTHSA